MHALARRFRGVAAVAFFLAPIDAAFAAATVALARHAARHEEAVR
ncbi:MAG TPA: hypothetical protein VFS59_13385 [Gemmatimonadaceae bacterium]|nr:hypothetical protein [Gemmatimonadaceae bacterium]